MRFSSNRAELHIISVDRSTSALPPVLESNEVLAAHSVLAIQLDSC